MYVYMIVSRISGNIKSIRHYHTLLFVLISLFSCHRLGGPYRQSWPYLLCGSCESYHHLAETHRPTCSSRSDPLQLHTADGTTQPQVKVQGHHKYFIQITKMEIILLTQRTHSHNAENFVNQYFNSDIFSQIFQGVGLRR